MSESGNSVGPAANVMDFRKSRENALKFYWEAVEAANPYKCVLEHLSRKSDILTVDKKRYNLKEIGSIYVVAFGKAATSMAEAVEEARNSRRIRSARGSGDRTMRGRRGGF